MIDASFLHKRALSLSSKGEKSLNFGENNSFNSTTFAKWVVQNTASVLKDLFGRKNGSKKA